MKDFARQLTQKCVSMGLLDESYSEWFAYVQKIQIFYRFIGPLDAIE